MKKSLVFVLVGLVYIVVAMAASKASTTNTLDKTLEFIGITPGTEQSSSPVSAVETKNPADNNLLEDLGNTEFPTIEKIKDEGNGKMQFAMTIPFPPPPDPGTQPKS